MKHSLDIKTNEIGDFFDAAAGNWNQNGADTDGAKRILEIDTIRRSMDDAKVLDVGCGTGVMIPHLLEAGAKSITAIDLSPKMIEIANKRDFGAAVNFEIKDIYDVEEKFDVVMMYNVYPHISHHDKLAKKLNEIMLPDGRFVIAHGAGREEINSHHEAHAKGISTPLQSANRESELLKTHFNIDILIDKLEIYCISGKI